MQNHLPNLDESALLKMKISLYPIIVVIIAILLGIAPNLAVKPTYAQNSNTNGTITVLRSESYFALYVTDEDVSLEGLTFTFGTGNSSWDFTPTDFENFSISAPVPACYVLRVQDSDTLPLPCQSSRVTVVEIMVGRADRFWLQNGSQRAMFITNDSQPIQACSALTATECQFVINIVADIIPLCEVQPDSAPEVGFAIHCTEVTQEAYRVFIGAGAYEQSNFWSVDAWQAVAAGDVVKPPLEFDGENLPMTNISWYEADAYCRWAGLSLPTQIQWLFAAQHSAPTTSTDGALLPVGSARDDALPNAYGIYDLIGNVAEYSSTPFDAGYLVLGGSNHFDISIEPPDGRFAAPLTTLPDVGFRCSAPERTE